MQWNRPALGPPAGAHVVPSLGFVLELGRDSSSWHERVGGEDEGFFLAQVGWWADGQEVITVVVGGFFGGKAAMRGEEEEEEDNGSNEMVLVVVVIWISVTFVP